MKKAAIALLALIVFASLALMMFQKQIGYGIFERAVHSRVATDNVSALDDALHLGLCGTGSPLPNPDRAGPCNVVIAGERIFVVDIGEGGARNLALMGVPAARVEAVLLTHFHSDHIDGLGPMMLLHWTQGTAKAPLPVYGPMGVEQVIAGFNQAYTLDRGYRVAHHGEDIVPPSGFGAVARPFSVDGDETVVLEEDGLKITAITVQHAPISPAVAYRLDYRGRSLVISGDTAKSANLAQKSNDVDILVHDSLQPRLVGMMTDALDDAGQDNTATITRDILDYHASPEQAAETAEIARARILVLSHLVPPIPNKFFYPAFKGNADELFAGEIVVVEDGMFFSLPAESDAIDRRSIF